MMGDIRITDLQSFRNYMFRKLGEEYFDIEISDLQWSDILRDSINYYVDYSSEGSYESLVLIDTNGDRSLILPEEIMVIKEILGVSNTKFQASFIDTYLSGDTNDVIDFHAGAFSNKSLSFVPNNRDQIYDGDLIAGDGSEVAYESGDDVTFPSINPVGGRYQSLYGAFGTDYGFSSGIYFPFFGTGSDLSMTTYAITRSMIDAAQSLFKTQIPFTYKSESKRLVMGVSAQLVLVRAEIREAPENFINDTFFKLIVEEKLLVQWANNLSLKYTSDQLMGNGIDLNIDRMDARAEVIRTRLEDGFDGDEWSGLLAPIRID